MTTTSKRVAALVLVAMLAAAGAFAASAAFRASDAHATVALQQANLNRIG